MDFRTSTILFFGAIAVFIAAWFPPANFLDFTADDMHKASIGASALLATFGLISRHDND